MRWITGFALAALMSTSATGQVLAAEKGARLHGVVETRAHTQVLAKWYAGGKPPGKGKINYAALSGYGGGGSEGDANTSDVVAMNYTEITEIFVILSHPEWQGGAVHKVELSPYGLDAEALAVSRGDIIRLHNKTANAYTPYLAGTGDDEIQVFPAVKPGTSSDLKVRITGDLELGLDEDEEEIIVVAAGSGWKSQQISSGKQFDFRELSAGTYDLKFWYWRLGALDHVVSLKAGEDVEINEVLSVDRIIK